MRGAHAMDNTLLVLLLFTSGVACGLINVVAGGGSFLTLPILIFLGLPAGVANGTNRVGIVLQNLAAVVSFRRHEIRTPEFGWGAAAVTSLGSLAGAAWAVEVSDAALQRILAILMVVVTVWTLASPPRAGERQVLAGWRRVVAFCGLFLAGVYGGFLQAGVGFLILAVTSFAGLDLVRGNAVKVFLILISSLLSLGVFAWQGRVAWGWGVVMALGTVLGGLLGVRLTVTKGQRWLRCMLFATVLAVALKLWLS